VSNLRTPQTGDPGRHVDAGDLIERRGVETHFHAIPSVRRKALIGVEALSRGIGSDGGLVPPLTLFAQAKTEGLTLELDRLCRAVAVESFRPLHAADPTLVLFLNVSAAAFDQDADGPHGFEQLAADANVDPQNIALELLEAEFGDTVRLREVVRRLRDTGFLVALDDVGAGHSNLDRITHVHPDILKVDRALVHGIQHDHYKREIFRAVVALSDRIGGWVITEGVEEECEAIVALDAGADMIQGYYFGRPHKLVGESVEWDSARVRETAVRFARYTVEKTTAARARRDHRIATARDVARAVAPLRDDELGGGLSEVVRRHSTIESACVLNAGGVQITDTAWQPARVQRQKTVIFRPPTRGTDHSSKEYYYLLASAGLDPYETAPYVPLPSGDLCVTVSIAYSDPAGERRIVAVHLRAEPD